MLGEKSLIDRIEAASPEQQRELLEGVADAVWLARCNVEDGDQRMAVENINGLICLLATGAFPNDLSSHRKLELLVQAALAEPGRTEGNRVVRRMGASLRTAISASLKAQEKQA